MSATAPSPLSQWLLLQLAENTLPHVVAAPLHRRARRDATWGSWYHLLRQTERGVGATDTPPPLSSNQKDLLRRLILDDPALNESTSTASSTIGAGALAAAAAGALVLIANPAPPSVPDAPIVQREFVARGQGDQLRLRVRCVVDGGVSADVEARVDAARLDCVAGGLLAIAVTNTSDTDRRVAVEVVDVDGIAASPLGDVLVPAGAVNVLVPTGLRLDGAGQRTLRLVDASSSAVWSADVVVVAR